MNKFFANIKGKTLLVVLAALIFAASCQSTADRRPNQESLATWTPVFSAGYADFSVRRDALIATLKSVILDADIPNPYQSEATNSTMREIYDLYGSAPDEFLIRLISESPKERQFSLACGVLVTVSNVGITYTCTPEQQAKYCQMVLDICEKMRPRIRDTFIAEDMLFRTEDDPFTLTSAYYNGSKPDEIWLNMNLHPLEVARLADTFCHEMTHKELDLNGWSQLFESDSDKEYPTPSGRYSAMMMNELCASRGGDLRLENMDQAQKDKLLDEFIYGRPRINHHLLYDWEQIFPWNYYAVTQTAKVAMMTIVDRYHHKPKNPERLIGAVEAVAKTISIADGGRDREIIDSKATAVAVRIWNRTAPEERERLNQMDDAMNIDRSDKEKLFGFKKVLEFKKLSDAPVAAVSKIAMAVRGGLSR